MSVSAHASLPRRKSLRSGHKGSGQRGSWALSSSLGPGYCWSTPTGSRAEELRGWALDVLRKGPGREAEEFALR